MSKKSAGRNTERITDLSFADEHYRRFVLYLDHLKKCTGAIETRFAERFSVKGVHLFWLYELSRFPEGLTSAELATLCNVNRSLLSREMPLLIAEDIVRQEDESKTKKYNRRYCLTEKGQALAEEIRATASLLQEQATFDVSPEDMAIFRRVLKALSVNFQQILDESPIFENERK